MHTVVVPDKNIGGGAEDAQLLKEKSFVPSLPRENKAFGQISDVSYRSPHIPSAPWPTPANPSKACGTD